MTLTLQKKKRKVYKTAEKLRKQSSSHVAKREKAKAARHARKKNR